VVTNKLAAMFEVSAMLTVGAGGEHYANNE